MEQFRLYGVGTETCARAQRDPTPERVKNVYAARNAHRSRLVPDLAVYVTISVGSDLAMWGLKQRKMLFVELSENTCLSPICTPVSRATLQRSDGQKQTEESRDLLPQIHRDRHGPGSRLFELAR